MRHLDLSRLGGAVTMIVFLAASPAAFADNGGAANSATPQSARSLSVPGASQQWCDSLPYPYCRDPAPGTPDSGPIWHPSPVQRPIFGD
jgi:hypothetical protein